MPFALNTVATAPRIAANVIRKTEGETIATAPFSLHAEVLGASSSAIVSVASANGASGVGETSVAGEGVRMLSLAAKLANASLRVCASVSL